MLKESLDNIIDDPISELLYSDCIDYVKFEIYDAEISEEVTFDMTGMKLWQRY